MGSVEHTDASKNNQNRWVSAPVHSRPSVCAYHGSRCGILSRAALDAARGAVQFGSFDSGRSKVKFVKCKWKVRKEVGELETQVKKLSALSTFPFETRPCFGPCNWRKSCFSPVWGLFRRCLRRGRRGALYLERGIVGTSGSCFALWFPVRL